MPNNDEFSAISERYKKELLSFYNQHRPTVVTYPNTAPQVSESLETTDTLLAEEKISYEQIVEKISDDSIRIIPTRSVEMSSSAPNPTEKDNDSATEEADFLNSEQEKTVPAAVVENTSPVGYLRVSVSVASQAIPISGTKVRIRGSGERNNIDMEYITDESGNTPRASLPAPQRELSLQPGSTELPYYEYTVDVNEDKYEPVHIENIPIFEDVLSIQPIALQPKNGNNTENINEQKRFDL